MSPALLEKLCAIPSAWKGGEALAEFLCVLTRPHVIVELGVDNGYSAVAWTVASNATVYAIDKEVRRARLYTEQMELDRLVLLEDTFQNVAARWTVPVDILHIDGEHDLASVTADFSAWYPHVRNGGLVVFHDTQSFPETVGRFFNARPEPKMEVQHFCGLGVLIKT